MSRYDTQEKLKQAAESSKRWKAKNPEINKALNRAWDIENKDKKRAYSTAKHARWKRTRPAEYWFNHLKHRAKARGLEFDLTVEFLSQLFENMSCAITGLPLSYDAHGGGKVSPWTPSVDQIVPGKGYTQDNVQLVCWAYNIAKHDWDAGVVIALARALLRVE